MILCSKFHLLTKSKGGNRLHTSNRDLSNGIAVVPCTCSLPFFLATEDGSLLMVPFAWMIGQEVILS